MFEKFEKFQVLLLSIVIAIGLVVAANIITSAISKDSIVVTGSYSQNVTSDSGRVEFEEDIEVKTPNGYNSYRILPNGNSSNEIAYYNISQSITVKSNDVKKIKEIATTLPDLISKGIDINVYEPSYFYSKLSEIKVQMLEEATKDAKQRASAMLKATHNRVGKIQSVKMGVFQITPVDSNDVSDMGLSDTSSIEKKITSVANVTFSVK